MKYILLLLIVFPLIGECQVYKFRAARTKLAIFNGKDYITKETNDVNILVVVNLDKDKVETYGVEEGHYDIAKKVSQDLDTAGTTTAVFRAVDTKGEARTLHFAIYGPSKRRENSELSLVASLGIEFGGTLLVFYLRKND